MTAISHDGGRTRPYYRSAKLPVALAVAAGLALFASANAHLVYVAVSSQPDCVNHLKGGEAAPGAGMFAAAKPSC